MSFQIQRDANIIRIILAGRLTVAEMGDLSRELARLEANSESTPDRLTDLSTVEESNFSYGTVARMAEENRIRVYPNKFRSAIVAPKPLDYGLARIYQTLGENPLINLQIFKTRAEAEAWLASKV